MIVSARGMPTVSFFLKWLLLCHIVCPKWCSLDCLLSERFPRAAGDCEQEVAASEAAGTEGGCLPGLELGPLGAKVGAQDPHWAPCQCTSSWLVPQPVGARGAHV